MSKVELPQHGNTIYPWPLWENGSVHRAKRGRHFHDISPESFRRSILLRAKTIGRKAVTRIKGDAVTFQFVDSESEDKTKPEERQARPGARRGDGR